MWFNIGFHSGFERATFNLEPGRWLTVDLHEVVIYDGTEHRVAVNLAPAGGLVFLPVRHVTLSFHQPTAARRHFIEVPAWHADSGFMRWTLMCQIFEVVGSTWIPITTAGDLATASGAAPPRDLEIDRYVKIADAIAVR